MIQLVLNENFKFIFREVLEKNVFNKTVQFDTYYITGGNLGRAI